jgi:carbon monoxide dehydrogenase subunit G
MTVKVGPVSSSYKGKVVFEKLDSASRTAEIVATGQDIRGRGGADLRLTSTVSQKASGETEVTTTSRVNITGILAQMGRGMVQDVSDQMFQIFSQRMRAELEIAPPATAAAETTAAPAPARAEALDVGALGARAAIRGPAFWVAFAAAAILAYLILR